MLNVHSKSLTWHVLEAIRKSNCFGACRLEWFRSCSTATTAGPVRILGSGSAGIC